MILFRLNAAEYSLYTYIFPKIFPNRKRHIPIFFYRYYLKLFYIGSLVERQNEKHIQREHIAHKISLNDLKLNGLDIGVVQQEEEDHIQPSLIDWTCNQFLGNSSYVMLCVIDLYFE